MLQFNCPQCQKVLRTNPANAGKRLKCPGCETIVQAPAGEAESIKTSPAAAPPRSAIKPPPLPSISDDDDDEAERPRRALVRRDDFDDEDDRPRRRALARREEDDDEEDRPRRRRRRSRDDDDRGNIRRARDNHTLTEFPVWAMILLHFCTCGIFTAIRLNLMHGQMPQNRHDDPSAGKAIGFLFIPFFNLYWLFFTYGRLCFRINEQRRLAGLRGGVPEGLAITMCILMIIPYIQILCFLFIAPVFSAIVQSNVNELCLADERR